MIQGFWKVLLLQLYCWEMVHLLSWWCYYRKSSWTSRAFFVKSPWGIIKESERKSDLFVRICDRKKTAPGKVQLLSPLKSGEGFHRVKVIIFKRRGKTYFISILRRGKYNYFNAELGCLLSCYLYYRKKLWDKNGFSVIIPWWFITTF